MAGPGHDFQIGQQRRIVQGGRHLAHAAAIGGHGLAAHIGGADLEPGLLGGGAHSVVIAEIFAAVDHGAADVPGGLPNVENTVAGAGDIGGVLPQHVPEQHLFQPRLGNGGIGDPGGDHELLPGLGLLHQLFGRRHVKGNAHAPLHHLTGGPVIGSVLPLTADLPLHCRQIQGLALGHGADAFDGVQTPGGHGLMQGPGQLIPVNGASIGGLGDVEAVALALLHTVCTVHRVTAQLPAQALRPLGQLRRVQIPPDCRLSLPKPAADQVISVDKEISPMGRVPGSLGRLLRRNGYPKLRQAHLSDGLLSQGQVDDLAAARIGSVPLPFIPNLLGGKSAHVHAQHPGAVQGSPSRSGRDAHRQVCRRQNAHGDTRRHPGDPARRTGPLFLLQGLLVCLFHQGPSSSFCCRAVARSYSILHLLPKKVTIR